ncbi:EAL domain-containing response regulator [Algibacillus agarilyticus]|uniref:EAL domain-containing response regulator n=1 Tax=Algibacillus agarilyticus TaxID=2234133 RepID=UPI000DCFB276|nr:EAL domain-containing response regulator [Algibacillus agarilyticus]
MKLTYRSAVAIDDDSFSLNFIKEQLSKAKIETVDDFHDPLEALEQIKQGRVTPELLILDLQMPQMDGITLLNHLGDIAFKGAIIIYSGFEAKVLALAEQIACENNLTILGSLPKPFTCEQLNQLLVCHQIDDIIEPKAEVEHHFNLANGELVLTRQPQICLKTGVILSYEVLSRWRNKCGAILPPAIFIEKLEDSGEIVQFQEQLFELAMRKISEDTSDAKYSINLSMTTIDTQDVPKLVCQSAYKYNVGLDRITVEVTESRLANDMQKAKEVLIRLRIMGVMLAIDDFGTGYSTLDKLCDLPFREVKLDRRYVEDCDLSVEKQAIIKSTVDIAKSMGLRTVAEGMERIEEVEIVTALGTDIGQGYYFSKPQMWI